MSFSRRRFIVPWFATSRFFVLSCYVLTGLVPFFFTNQAPWVIIAIWAVATIPQTLVSVAFTVVMGTVAGPGGRMALMSRRWAILGLTNSVTVLIVGQLLERYHFPLNYQIVFIGSAVGALVSFVFSSSIKLPPVEVPVLQQPFGETLRHHSQRLRHNRRFVNFTISQFVFRWGLALAIPLFPIYWVRNLQASDQTVSLINSTTTFVTMIAYFVWVRVAQRRGGRWVLLVSAFGVCWYPLLTAMTKTSRIAAVVGRDGWLLLRGDRVGLLRCVVEHVSGRPAGVVYRHVSDDRLYGGLPGAAARHGVERLDRHRAGADRGDGDPSDRVRLDRGLVGEGGGGRCRVNMDIPQELLEQIGKGNVVLFCGVGISISEGGIPSGNQSGGESAERAGLGDVGTMSLPEVAQSYELGDGRTKPDRLYHGTGG